MNILYKFITQQPPQHWRGEIYRLKCKHGQLIKRRLIKCVHHSIALVGAFEPVCVCVVATNERELCAPSFTTNGDRYGRIDANRVICRFQSPLSSLSPQLPLPLEVFFLLFPSSLSPSTLLNSSNLSTFLRQEQRERATQQRKIRAVLRIDCGR